MMQTDRLLEAIALSGADVEGADLKTVKLFHWGRTKTRKGEVVIDDESAASMLQAFTTHGNDVPVDFEHATVGGEYATPNGRADAVGWIKKLSVRAGDGIYAGVQWLQPARDAIIAKSYKYWSPHFRMRADDRRVVELLSAGLTNVPAQPNMEELAASDRGYVAWMNSRGVGVERRNGFTYLVCKEGSRAMELLQKLKELLGITGEASPEQVLEACAKAIRGAKKDAELATSVRKRLSLADDAGADEVVLALAIAGANSEVLAMKSGEENRKAMAVVQEYIDSNLLNANDAGAIDAALSIAKRDPAKLKSMFKTVTSKIAPGRTQAPKSDFTQRGSIITEAMSRFDGDKQAKKITSCEAMVNCALRDSGLSQLTAEEKTRYSIAVA